MPERDAHGDVAALPFDTECLRLLGFKIRRTANLLAKLEVKAPARSCRALVFGFGWHLRGEKHTALWLYVMGVKLEQGNELNGFDESS
jgi:hypothetical protein